MFESVPIATTASSVLPELVPIGVESSCAVFVKVYLYVMLLLPRLRVAAVGDSPLPALPVLPAAALGWPPLGSPPLLDWPPLLDSPPLAPPPLDSPPEVLFASPPALLPPVPWPAAPEAEVLPALPWWCLVRRTSDWADALVPSSLLSGALVVPMHPTLVRATAAIQHALNRILCRLCMTKR